MTKKRRNREFVTLLFVLFVISSIGCKKQEVVAPQPVKKDVIKTKPSTAVQNQQSSSRLAGNPPPPASLENVKDPFKPFVVEVKSVSPVFGKGSGHGLLPIQSYDVGQFSVQGIVAGLRQNSALVVDPSGKAYVVKAGMEIGKNGGKIVKITSNGIEVKEMFRDENGKIKTKIMRLTLPRKQ